MKKNLGKTDKIIRIVIALVLAALLYFTDYFIGTIAIVGLAIAIILLLTSLFDFCPIYRIFGINTCKAKK